MQQLDPQTRQLVHHYLEGSICLEDMRRKFMRLDWARHRSEGVRLYPVTARLRNVLANYNRNDTASDEIALRGVLASL